jgi:uncharacterized protein (TIGR03382 family)
MQTTHSIAAALVLLSAAAIDASADPRKLVRSQDAIPDEYIVILKGASEATSALARTDNARSEHAREVARLATAHHADVKHQYGAAIRGFSAHMTEADALALADDDAVEMIVPNTREYLDEIQMNAEWGLDRIDQRTLPLDKKFVDFGDGEGVTVYVVDSGVRPTHDELVGRVLPGFYAAGTSAYDALTATTPLPPGDCNGHGTHVAGTIAGTTYGIAKRAKIVPVRAFSCNGGGATADTLAGIDWIIKNKKPNSVANFSIGGPPNDARELAVRNLIAAGITVVVAAGNENIDACMKGPAREPLAITVAASDVTDKRAFYSNYGSCVDIFAPGGGGPNALEIKSAGITSDSSTALKSGTSMATPHVTGTAAVYLAMNPGATPAQVTEALLAGSVGERISDLKGSPNKLLQLQFVDKVAPEAAFVSPAPDAKVAQSFTVELVATDDHLASVELQVDGASIGTASEEWSSFDVANLVPGKHELTLIATDMAGTTTTKTIAITVDDPNAPDPYADGGVIASCSTSGAAGGLPLALLGLAFCFRRRRR